MNIKVNILLFLLFAFSISHSQSNLLNAEFPEDIGEKDKLQLRQDENKKLEYGYVDDKDILFSKVIWEIIDLDQKVNFPYLYPTDTSVVGKERRPLIHHLLKGIENGKITLIYDDGKFNNKISYDDFISQNTKFGGLSYREINNKGNDYLDQFGGKNFVIEDNQIPLGEQFPPKFYEGQTNDFGDPIQDLQEWFEYTDYLVNDEQSMDSSILDNFISNRDNALMDWFEENYGEKYVSTYNFDYSMIDHYKIKGVWYFDKKIAQLLYRPIAIAPVSRQTINMKSDATALPEDLSKPVEMFWIYYPDAREVLKQSFVFSDSNSAIRKSFDELINARRFDTMIYLEENMYEDRLIEDYVKDNSFMRLLESERIKEKIRNFEHDMWSW